MYNDHSPFLRKEIAKGEYALILRIKKFLVFSVSIFTLLLGIMNLISSLPLRIPMPSSTNIDYVYFPIRPAFFHRSFSVLIGFALILISFGLIKRIKTAWLFSTCLLLLSLCLNLLQFHRLMPIALFDILTLFLMFLLHTEFTRRPSPPNIRQGIALAGLSLLMTLFYATLGFFLLNRQSHNPPNLFHSFLSAVKLFYTLDISALPSSEMRAIFFARSAVFFNWFVLLMSLVFLLRPLIYEPLIASFDRDKVRSLLKKYADNPISYVAVETDKRYFWGISVEGVIAYALVRNVIICAGDPLCSKSDLPAFMTEFISFCRKNDYEICFCQVMPQTADILSGLGFGIAKYGEECMFDLNSYTLEGSSASRLRQGLRRAEKLGIHIDEYNPHLGRNKELERQIAGVSNEWLAGKKSAELKFMLGTISLENPYDRRYFMAFDKENVLQAFIVFTPFLGGQGYMADVTRRRRNAPFGVMEKLTVDALFKMKSEGIRWGSLGLAPLYNVKDSDYSSSVNSLFDYVYHKLNMFYGFQALYQYKQKYAPTSWEPRYLAYIPKMMTPSIAYALIKSQNPHGITDYLTTQLRRVLGVHSLRSAKSVRKEHLS